MVPVSAVTALPQIMQAAPAIAQAIEDPRALAQDPRKIVDLLDAVGHVAGSILGLPAQGSSAQYGSVLRSVVDLVTGLKASGADRATLDAAAGRLTAAVDEKLSWQRQLLPSPDQRDRVELLQRMRAEVQSLIAPAPQPTTPSAPPPPPRDFHTGPIRTV